MKKAAWALLVLVAVAGCKNHKTVGVTTGTTGTGTEIPSQQALMPGADPGPNAVLTVGGAEIKVSVDHQVEKDSVQLKLTALGETIEEERYQSDSTNFSVISVGGERFEPPLQLLKFPMNVGDTWSWKGKIFSGEASEVAEAQVTSSSKQLLIDAGSYDTVLVEVVLKIGGEGDAKPVERKLQFWFAPEKGLVKRQFGIGSTRETSKE